MNYVDTVDVAKRSDHYKQHLKILNIISLLIYLFTCLGNLFWFLFDGFSGMNQQQNERQLVE